MAGSIGATDANTIDRAFWSSMVMLGGEAMRPSAPIGSGWRRGMAESQTRIKVVM
jgi:hypothetical protein